MKSPLLVRIAATHLLSKKRQTIAAVLGVTFGVMVFVFQAGLITGLQKFFIQKTVDSTAHIRLYNDAARQRLSALDLIDGNSWNIVRHTRPEEVRPHLKNGMKILRVLEKDPRVLGVAPFLSTQVFYRRGPVELAGVVAGIDVERQDKLFDLQSGIVEGDLRSLAARSDGLIMGSGLADKAGVQLGDWLTLTSPQGGMVELKVVGIHRSGLTEVDNSRSLVSLNTAQNLLGQGREYITDLNIKLHDVERADEWAPALARQFNCRAVDWKEANAPVFSVFKIQNMLTYVIISSILLVAGFGIYNILTMMIYENMADIAILKSIGFSDAEVATLFVIEALSIGVIGSLCGALLGLGLSLGISRIPFHLQGFITVEHLVINFDPLFYVAAFFLGTLSTSLAGLLPARRAARLDPVEIMRNKAV